MNLLDSSIPQILAFAYDRPCFLCKLPGSCRHREPLVELAMFGASQRAAQEVADTLGEARILQKESTLVDALAQTGSAPDASRKPGYGRAA